METLTAIVSGTSYLLSGTEEETPFLLTVDDGTGMAPVERFEASYAQQHGATDMGFRLLPRNIKLVLDMFPNADYSADDLEDLILTVFRPSTSPITLKWVRENGSVFCIDGHYGGDMSFASSDRYGIIQRAVIDFRCADPTFYDPTPQFVGFAVESGGTSGLTFPSPTSGGAFKWTFAAPAAINSVSPLAYTGTWLTYPIVEIVGPATNPIITADAVNAKLDFTGTTISAGVSYIIDTRPEHEGVVDSNGVARDDKLTNDSDLVSFRLQPEPDVVEGINPIRVQLSGAGTGTAVYVRYYRRFVGRGKKYGSV